MEQPRPQKPGPSKFLTQPNFLYFLPNENFLYFQQQNNHPSPFQRKQ